MTKAWAKQSVEPGFTNTVSNSSHWPLNALPRKSTVRFTVTRLAASPSRRAQVRPMALSASAVISPPWTKPRLLQWAGPARRPRTTVSPEVRL